MRNERPGFIKNAIAVAISSSFICTSALTDDLELEVNVWDSKKSRLSPVSGKFKFTQTQGDNFELTGSHHTSRVYSKTQPYMARLSNFQEKGLGIVVTTTNSEDGQSAAEFTVHLQKNGQDAFTMHRNMVSGRTTFSAHPNIVDTLKAKITERHEGEYLTDSDTGVVSPETTASILRKLVHSDDLVAADSQALVTIESPDAPIPTPPFVNKVPPGTVIPDTVSMIDADGAIAAMMTAFVQTSLPNFVAAHPAWAGDADGLPEPLQFMMQNQPGFIIGAKDIQNLATIKGVPVFLIDQPDEHSPISITYIPRSSVTTAHLVRHRNQAVQGHYERLKLSKTTAKDLRRRSDDSLLEQLIKMQARFELDGSLPTQEDMLQLASDQDMMLLCDAKLQYLPSDWEDLSISPAEQDLIASRVDKTSLPVFIRAQYRTHPKVGEFVVSATFETAANDHLQEKVAAVPDQDEKSLVNYYETIYSQKTKIAARPIAVTPPRAVSPATPEPVVDDLEDRIKLAAGAQDEETAEQAVARLVQEKNTATEENQNSGEQLEAIEALLTETEGNLGDDFNVDPDSDTPDKRLKHINQFRTEQKATLKHQLDSAVYIRENSEEILPLDIVRVGQTGLLTQGEFQAMQAVNLPQNMLPEDILHQLRVIEPIVVYFDAGTSEKTLDQFAGELPDIQRQFFQLPDHQGGVMALRPDQADNFNQHMQANYGLADTAEILNVITQFYQDDVRVFGNHVRDIRQIHTTLGGEAVLPRLQSGHVMSLQRRGLDYNTLQLMTEHYYYASEAYEDTWHQAELAHSNQWLSATPVVPTVVELGSFPDSKDLPSDGRLTAFKLIAGYTHLTPTELVTYIKAAAAVMHSLPPAELHRLQALIAKPYSDDTAEPHFRGIANSIGMPGDEWHQIYELAKHPSGLWKHTYTTIEANGGLAEVTPVYVTVKDMHLALSPFDSTTVIETRRLRDRNTPAYDAKVAAQEELQQKFNEQMRGIEYTTSSEEVYNAEQLRRFPDDADLTDLDWKDPLKAFYLKFGENPNRQDVVQYARILSQFSDDEYVRLIGVVDDVVPLVGPDGQISPDNTQQFNTALTNAGLADKSSDILEYVRLAGDSSKGNLEHFQETASDLVRHSQAGVVTVQHIEIALDEATPDEIMNQRQILKHNPAHYDTSASAPAARTWLAKHPHLIVEPESLMTPDEHHAMRGFVQAVAMPGTGGDIYAQHDRIQVIVDMLEASRTYEGFPISHLPAELAKPGYSADELVAPDGTIVDANKLATVATNMGVTDPTHHQAIANLLKHYRESEALQTVVTETNKLTKDKIQPADITPRRLELINNPSVDDVDYTLKLASTASIRTEYMHALHAKERYDVEARSVEYRQTIRLAQEYKPAPAPESGYSAARFTKQKAMQGTLETVKREIGQTALPDFDEEPEGDTPYHDQLRQKHAALTTSRNLKETKQLIESWDEEPLVVVTDQLTHPLTTLMDTDLPPDLPDFDHLTEVFQDAKGHKANSRVAERTELETILAAEDSQTVVQKFGQYAQNKDLQVDSEVHTNMLKLQGWLDVEEWTDAHVGGVITIVKPWYQDKQSPTAKAFHTYLASEKKPVLEKFEELETPLGVGIPSAVKNAVKAALTNPVVNDAVAMGKVRHGLYATYKVLQPAFPQTDEPTEDDHSSIEDIRQQLLKLKGILTSDGAYEIEGAAEMQQQLEGVDDQTPLADVLRVSRDITGKKDTVAEHLPDDLKPPLRLEEPEGEAVPLPPQSPVPEPEGSVNQDTMVKVVTQFKEVAAALRT